MNRYDVSRKRKHRVPVRLDDDEYKKLKEWSAATNRTMSDYLRELLDDNQPMQNMQNYFVLFQMIILEKRNTTLENISLNKKPNKEKVRMISTSTFNYYIGACDVF